MTSNLFIHKTSLFFRNDLAQYLANLNILVETRRQALDKRDLVFKPGNWQNDVLNEIVDRIDPADKMYKEIVRGLSFLFNSKAVALNLEPNTLDDIDAIYNNRPNAFLGLYFEEKNIRFIRSIEDWYVFHRDLFIQNPPDINSFCTSLAPYFNNLYFNSESIINYLPTLHCKTHIPIMRTIIHHLSSLNDIFFDLFREYHKEGVNRVCDRFQQMMHKNPIKFGSSTDKDSIGSLELDFTDKELAVTKTLYCDPHTKLWEYFEDGFDGDQYDRIYFHQPVNNFLDERILIARIGRHRERIS